MLRYEYIELNNYMRIFQPQMPGFVIIDCPFHSDNKTYSPTSNAVQFLEILTTPVQYRFAQENGGSNTNREATNN